MWLALRSANVGATTMRPDEPALRQAKRVRDFAYHLTVYLFVNALCVILDVRAGAGDQAVLGLDWAYWLLLFWGFGILGHAVSVFLSDDRFRRPRGGDHARGS
jgi:2TM domain